MKDVVDKCSTKGCAIDIGTVIDNDNCTSKFSRFFATREEAESFMTKLKELAAATSSADEGASVAYKIKDLEGQVELDAAFTFSCQAEMIKALELARHNDAHLTLIHIDDGLSELYPGIYFPATEDILQLLKNKSDNKLYKLTKNIQWPKTKLRIERGEMPETLLEIMQKEQCDLLVCGHHHSFINRLMPAYRGMINKMSADLLIVPFIDK